MALKDLISLSLDKGNKKMGLSEERVQGILPVARQYISFWREYPDIFVEFLCGNNPNNFKLYFYQRFHILVLLFQKNDYLLEKLKILHNRNKFQSKNQINH